MSTTQSNDFKTVKRTQRLVTEGRQVLGGRKFDNDDKGKFNELTEEERKLFINYYIWSVISVILRIYDQCCKVGDKYTKDIVFFELAKGLHACKFQFCEKTYIDETYRVDKPYKEQSDDERQMSNARCLLPFIFDVIIFKFGWSEKKKDSHLEIIDRVYDYFNDRKYPGYEHYWTFIEDIRHYYSNPKLRNEMFEEFRKSQQE
jgi:hypothetical protein